MDDHPILFAPGPTEVDAELRAIMSMPLVGHRSAGFIDEVKAVCGKLQGLFLTGAHALFENCSATALMEVAVRNLVNERVLHLTCGAFGERWAKVSAACGRQADTIAVEWGQPNLAEALAGKLAASGPYEAVAVTFNETSTGCLNPLREIAATVREHAPDTLVLVDVVSGLGGAEFRFDDWGLDLAFAGTQKCLALPPGLCVYAVSERAMEKAATVPHRGFLTDITRAKDALGKGRTPATPCVPLVYALSRQLDRIAAEGLEARWARHLAMRDAVTEWADAQGFEFLVAEPWRSPTVSTMLPSGRDVADLIARAGAAGFTLANGYGLLKGKTFRIGHMGDHPVERVQALLRHLS